MKKYFSLLVVLGLILLVANPATAASKYGTKAYGMGGAFTAIADDASAIYWNPAGLTESGLVGVQANAGSQLKMDDIQAIVDMIKQVEDLQDSQGDSMALLEGLKDLDVPDDVTINANGMTAINLTKFGAGVIVNDKFSFEGGEQEVTITESGKTMTEKVPSGTATNEIVGQGIVGMGMSFLDVPLLGGLSIGANGKYLYRREDIATISATEDSIGITTPDATTETGAGADVGALMTISTPMIEILELKAGATVKNLVATLDSPLLEKTTTVGLGAKLDLLKVLSARVAADLEMPETGEDIQRVGVEGTLGLFSVRGGAYGTDLATDEARTITYGAGFNLPFIDFNLAGDDDGYVSASGTFNF